MRVAPSQRSAMPIPSVPGRRFRRGAADWPARSRADRRTWVRAQVGSAQTQASLTWRDQLRAANRAPNERMDLLHPSIKT